MTAASTPGPVWPRVEVAPDGALWVRCADAYWRPVASDRLGDDAVMAVGGEARTFPPAGSRFFGDAGEDPVHPDDEIALRTRDARQPGALHVPDAPRPTDHDATPVTAERGDLIDAAGALMQLALLHEQLTHSGSATRQSRANDRALRDRYRAAAARLQAIADASA